jgi:mannan endo-1,4-beta-mannosidase
MVSKGALVLAALITILLAWPGGAGADRVAAQPPHTPSSKPANPNATPAAVAVLEWLYTLAERPQDRIILGQHAFFGDGENPTRYAMYLEEWQRETGDTPAMTGFDMNSAFYRGEDPDYAKTVQFAIEQWQAGRLLNVSWHMPNYLTGDAAFNNRCETQPINPSLEPLYTEGSPANERFRAAMDKVAAAFDQMQQAGVVILWRPFHEAHCWFWWGDTESVESFRLAWRYMFTYLTERKGLNNLLWVWSPNWTWDEWASPVDKYYPGADVVDTVGVDYYGVATSKGLAEFEKFGQYEKLVAFGKPIMVNEFGGLGSNGQGWGNTQMDAARFIADLTERFPRIVGLYFWEDIHRLTHFDEGSGYSLYTNERAVVELPVALTLRDMPRFDVAP